MLTAVKCLAEMEELPPARLCLVCERPIEEIGGRRMVAQPLRGTTLLHHPIDDDFRNFRVCIRLFDGRDLYLVAWGEESVFPEKAIERARQDYLAGSRPWFCQVCGRRQCHVCGEVLPRPVASDYVFDDGGIVHCPILGADPGCSNPGCSRFRSDGISGRSE